MEKRNFYAWQHSSPGTEVWRFATKRERDEWVEGGYWRKPLAGSEVKKLFRTPGVFVRWAKPQFVRPQ